MHGGWGKHSSGAYFICLADKKMRVLFFPLLESGHRGQHGLRWWDVRACFVVSSRSGV